MHVHNLTKQTATHSIRVHMYELRYAEWLTLCSPTYWGQLVEPRRLADLGLHYLQVQMLLFIGMLLLL